MSGQDLSRADPRPPIAWAGLQELLSAWKHATTLNRTPHEFAVEIDALKQLGLGNSDLRWLICKGYVQHLVDESRLDQAGRLAVMTESLRLVPESCFVLTPAGVLIAESCERYRVQHCYGKNIALTSSDVPAWDITTRVLRLGPDVVANFETRAPAQEQILAAFEEEGWPVRIDDPLTPNGEGDHKTRLNKAIHRLNKHVNSPHIHFCSDGGGQGVCWHRAGEANCPATQASRDEDQ